MRIVLGVARAIWRYVLRVIELVSAVLTLVSGVLTIVSAYVLLQQVDWAMLAHLFHLR
jgi:hypothetical protein